MSDLTPTQEFPVVRETEGRRGLWVASAVMTLMCLTLGSMIVTSTRGAAVTPQVTSPSQITDFAPAVGAALTLPPAPSTPPAVAPVVTHTRSAVVATPSTQPPAKAVAPKSSPTPTPAATTLAPVEPPQSPSPVETTTSAFDN